MLVFYNQVMMNEVCYLYLNCLDLYNMCLFLLLLNILVVKLLLLAHFNHHHTCRGLGYI